MNEVDIENQALLFELARLKIKVTKLEAENAILREALEAWQKWDRQKYADDPLNITDVRRLTAAALDGK